MTKLLKPAAAAGLTLAALATPFVLSPAAAQAARARTAAAAPAGVARGIGVVNAPGVIVNSNAYKAAVQQRAATYKAQIDQYNARRQAITTQLQPLVNKYQTDSAAPNANQTTLQQEAAQIQQIQQSANTELQTIVAPVQLSQAYAEEQLQDKLGQAIESAAKKRGVTLVISPDNVLYADNAYNLSPAVVDELNALVPSVQVVPPAGWLPRELREQQAQQQAAQQQAGATAPAPGAAAPATRPATTGR
jgi:Skp family chaperone for outer membrane proteins